MKRSLCLNTRHFRRFGHVLALTALSLPLLAASGCSLGFATSMSDGSLSGPVPNNDAGEVIADGGAGPVATSDASAAPDAFLGSPLCRASRSPTTCYPDDTPTAAQCTARPSAGADAGMDAGAASHYPDAAVSDAGSFWDAGTDASLGTDAGESWDATMGFDAGAPPPSDAGAVEPDGSASDASIFDAGQMEDGSSSDGDAGDGAVPGLVSGDRPGLAPEFTEPDGAVVEAGCRVVSLGSGPGPICEAAGAGTEDSACRTGSDCAPEYDCVVDPGVGMAGVCRKYCCDYSCGDGGSSASAGRYCGIASVSGIPSLQIPVCLTVAHCSLTDATTCGPDMTCSVVDPDGTTSCMAIGAGKAGDECETQLCGAGLAWIGVSGSRTCFELCDATDGGECVGDAGGDSASEETGGGAGGAADAGRCCPAGQSCKTSQPLFANPAVGVCLP